jgi:hypothetical protein
MCSTRYSCRDLTKLEFSRPIYETYSNVKFHGKPSGGKRVVLWGQTDMTKLSVAFRNFAKAPNKKGQSTMVAAKLKEVIIWSKAGFYFKSAGSYIMMKRWFMLAWITPNSGTAARVMHKCKVLGGRHWKPLVTAHPLPMLMWLIIYKVRHFLITGLCT